MNVKSGWWIFWWKNFSSLFNFFLLFNSIYCIGKSIQTSGGKSRSIKRAALPRWRATDKRWNKCLISSEFNFPQRRAQSLAMSLRSLTASESQPPKVSTTSGKNTMPWARQLSKWSLFFEFLRISMAAAGISAARWMIASWVGETTLMSKAIFLPSIQEGTKTSAGRDWDPGMRFHIFFLIFFPRHD